MQTADKIVPDQIKKIHALKGRLGLNDEEYRLLITDFHGFSSTCKDLSRDDADLLIKHMEKEAISLGVWNKPSARRGGKKAAWGKTMYDELGDRPGFATPKQLRKIEAMWSEVTRAKGQAAREKALAHFLKRQVGVEAMAFVLREHVQIIIHAINHMRRDNERAPF